jgi:hypothetical protein
MDRGTYLPLPVSVKKVSKEPALSEAFESGSKRPSALSPCSRRYLESFVDQRPANEKGGEGPDGHTVPKHCSQVGYRPGRCEDGTPARDYMSAIAPRRSYLRDVKMVWRALGVAKGQVGQLKGCAANI